LLSKILNTIKYTSVKGSIGEGITRLFTSGLNNEDYYKIHDLMIKRNGGETSQIDHLFISQYGIFVIETKNYKGWIFGNEKDKYWTQTIYQHKEKMFNPIWQNKGHIQALKEILEEFGELPFISIIAFSPRATLKTINIDSDHTYVNDQMQVSQIIKSYHKPLMSHYQSRKIYEKLESLNIKGLDAKITHAQNIQRELKQKHTLAAHNICPKCGGELKPKEGKYGNFKGCSGYPKCRYTVK
jgi:hypothetical protein